MTHSLLFSILSFYGILVVVNIPAPWLGLHFEEDNSNRLWYVPPGYVIPIVWFVLFTLLGVAQYLLVQKALQQQWWLYGLAVLCASYAYYTLGLAKLTGISALWYGLAGNMVVLLCTGLVVWRLLAVNQTVALLTLPVSIWTLFATCIVWGELKQQRLI